MMRQLIGPLLMSASLFVSSVSPGEAAPSPRETTPRERDVTYKVTPAGLIVEVDGLRFVPHAEVKKAKGGGFGVELLVDVEVLDGRTHTFLSPKHGPLSLAARVYNKRGNKIKEHSDVRDGDGRLDCKKGESTTLKRGWPSGALKGPLFWGQTLELRVGLWGFGVGKEAGRPLHNLFDLKLRGGANPEAVISPPEV